MMTKQESEIVDRSRLKLLGVLAAAGASGGCGAGGAPHVIGGDDLEKDNPFKSLRNTKSKPKKTVTPTTGGEGEGGGGSH